VSGKTIALAAALFVPPFATAATFTDDFNTTQNYKLNGVSGTIWDGMLGGSNTSAADANTTTAGQLSVSSTNGDWENGGNDGFFLYKNVTGDFTATVYVADSNNIDYHDRGLGARVGGGSENYVFARYFTPSGGSGGNSLRNTVSSSSNNIDAASPPTRWLKLNRTGNVFTTTFASDAAFTTGVTSASVTRNDVGTTVQVGLWQATFGGNQGNAKFDDFTLITGTAPTTATLTYNGNGSTGGNFPVDLSSPYTTGTAVTVLGNTGSLTRTNFAFTGWNTAADGSGANYSAGNTFNIASNTTLYAKWVSTITYTLTYNGNGSTGGAVPVDPSSPYPSGTSVTVLGNSGNLIKSGLSFSGWNTADNGSGTSYSAGNAFNISSNTTLYAKWTSETLPPTPVVTNQAPLVATPFAALPLGSVRPQGWLLTQCELQKSGQTGNAEQLYGDLDGNSGWLGGSGESWERGPYYFKGLIPLAYVMNDADLKLKAQKWMDWLLNNQRPDGSIGPASNDDWWPRMIATYALKDYYEATADSRVIPVLTNYFNYMRTNLPGRPLKEWGKARAGDQLDVVLWLYNRTNDANLLTLADLIKQQAYDWKDIFTNNEFMSYGADIHTKHNVNVTQAMKLPAVYYQRSNSPADRDALSLGLDHLMREHGHTCGINSGTEQVAGHAAMQGVELCSTVEAMLSLETAAFITGDPALLDRLEKITFNALPGGLTKDHKGHQYYTLPNCVIMKNGFSGYVDDRESGLSPGPESGYPCCRFNLHMGWPKFIQNSWAATSDGGLAAMAYGPNVVNAMISGTQVQITQNTTYPFEEQISLNFSMSSPVAFPLKLRIPAWCPNATVTVNGAPQAGITSGSFLTLSRTWASSDVVVLNFPMSVKTEKGPSRSVSVNRGPLVYSLRIGENWTQTWSYFADFKEFRVEPTTPWNYALQLDPANPGAAMTFSSQSFTGNPFDPANNPVKLSLSAKLLPEWEMGSRGMHAFEPPTSPVASSSQPAPVELVPFGSQHMRISWFPYLGTPAPTVGSFTENFDSTWSERWTVIGGNMRARDSALSTMSNSNGGAKAVAIATKFADFIYEADVKIGTEGDAGLLLRLSKPDIGNDNYHGYYFGIDAKNDQVVFGKSLNAWTSLGNAAKAINPNQYYRLKIEAIGANFRLFVDDMVNPVIDVNDATISEGMIGTRIHSNFSDNCYSSFTNLTANETTVVPPTGPTVTLALAGSPLPEAAGSATVTATLSEVHTLDVTVNLAFSGTATLTSDYTRSGNSIFIPAGSTTGTVTLTAVQDALYESPDETIVVDISTVTNATESGIQKVTATIANDDPIPPVTGSIGWQGVRDNAFIGTAIAGVTNVDQNNWNQSGNEHGGSPMSNLVNDTGTGTSLDVSWTGDSWGGDNGGSSSDWNLLHGSLENGVITLSEIPFVTFDLYVYLAGSPGRTGSVRIDQTATNIALGDRFYFTSNNSSGNPATWDLTTDTVGTNPTANYAKFTGVVRDGAGNLVITFGNGTAGIAGFQIVDTTVVPSSPYASWSSGAGFSTDSNGDGVKNGMAWFLGASAPATNALSLLPKVTAVGASSFTTRFTRVLDAGAAHLYLEYSDNLSGWTSVEVPTASGTFSGINFTVGTVGGLYDIIAQVPFSSTGRRFTHLVATE
jgi:regulation of enolase protein 1 (concanavalin A-like superfamily)